MTIFCLFVEKVDGVFKSIFYISTGILWGKMLPLEEMWFLIIVGQWAKFFPAFCRKNSESFIKTAFHISKKNILLKKSFGGSFFFITCWQWTKNCLFFVKKSFSRVVETAFSASIGKFWGEFFQKIVLFHFRIFRGQNFKFFGEISDKSVETAFSFVSIRTFWGKRVFFGKIF